MKNPIKTERVKYLNGRALYVAKLGAVEESGDTKEAAEARQYSDSLQAFVLARLLGLLTVHPLPPEGDHLSFRFSYERTTDFIAEEFPGGQRFDTGVPA